MSLEDQDPLIDSLLEETLGGVAPSDLSSRILQAWAERQLGSSSLSSPPLNVYSDVEPEAPPFAPAVRLPSPSSNRGRERRRKVSSWSLPLIGSLAAAAAFLIAVTALREFADVPAESV